MLQRENGKEAKGQNGNCLLAVFPSCPLTCLVLLRLPSNEVKGWKS